MYTRIRIWVRSIIVRLNGHSMKPRQMINIPGPVSKKQEVRLDLSFSDMPLFKSDILTPIIYDFCFLCGSTGSKIWDCSVKDPYRHRPLFLNTHSWFKIVPGPRAGDRPSLVSDTLKASSRYLPSSLSWFMSHRCQFISSINFQK